MSPIPKMFLRRIFVKNSCKNVDGSLIFQLKNPFGASITEIHYLRLNNEDIPIEKMTCQGDKHKTITQLEEIATGNPFVMNQAGTVDFTIKDYQLKPGENTLEISFKTDEIGDLEIEVQVKA